MTVQVRKVASISVLCSFLFFFAWREAVLLKRRFISSKNFYDRYTSFRASFSLYHTPINWTRSLPVGIADYDNHVRVYGILDAMVLMIIKGCLSFKCLQPLVSNKNCSGVYVYDKVNDFSELTLHHSRPGLTWPVMRLALLQAMLPMFNFCCFKSPG